MDIEQKISFYRLYYTNIEFRDIYFSIAVDALKLISAFELAYINSPFICVLLCWNNAVFYNRDKFPCVFSVMCLVARTVNWGRYVDIYYCILLLLSVNKRWRQPRFMPFTNNPFRGIRCQWPSWTLFYFFIFWNPSPDQSRFRASIGHNPICPAYRRRSRLNKVFVPSSWPRWCYLFVSGKKAFCGPSLL